MAGWIKKLLLGGARRKFMPTLKKSRDLRVSNLELEDGGNFLLEDSSYLLLES